MKKAMSTILGSLLVVMLVFTTLSYRVNAAWTPDGVYVGGQNVGGGGYWKTTEEGEVVSGTEEDYNVKYENGNLTLKNATIKQATSYNWDNSGNCDSAAIYVSNGDLTIHLVGANTIVGTDNNHASSYGIYVFGILTIEGQGSLNVTSGKASDNADSVSAAIFAKVMNLNGCSIEAVGNTGNASYGLYTYYIGPEIRINIRNAQVTAKGNTRAVCLEGNVDLTTPKLFTVIYKACRTMISFDGKVVGDTFDISKWKDDANGIYQRYSHTNELMKGSKEFKVVNEHVWIEKVEDKHKVSGATCKEYAVYHKSCSVCGTEHETETFQDETAGLEEHTWVEKAEDAYKVSDATYEKPAVYKKSCSVCGTTHESDTFTYGQALVREENKNTGNQTLASTPDQTVNQTTNQVPKTGDVENMSIWFVLCMMCGATVVMTMKKMKNR